MKNALAEDLLVSHRPVDRVAYRVIKKAKPEDKWEPTYKIDRNKAFSRERLELVPLPHEMAVRQVAKQVTGQRRGRMTVLGYAGKTEAKHCKARWVVRCDCGNYEHRTQILRWIGTDADDACVECRARLWSKGARHNPEGATRKTRDLHQLRDVASKAAHIVQMKRRQP